MKYPVIFPWSIEANYPAGPDPWDALPTKVAPAGDYWTPNTKPAAQNFNYVLNQMSNGADQSIIDWAGPIPAQNWGPLVDAVTTLGLGAGYVIDVAYWDDAAALWILAVRNTGPSPQTVNLYAGTGSPNCLWHALSTFTAPTGGAAPTSGVVVSVTNDPTIPNEYYLGTLFTDTLNSVFIMKVAGGATTTVEHIPGTGTGYTDIQMSNFASSVIACIACASTPANSRIMWSTDSGATWSQNLTGTVIGPWNIPAAFGANWVATSATSTLPINTYSSDGTIFHFGTLGGFPSSGDTPQGLAFGADGGGNTYFQMYFHSPTTKLLRSIDGITWTDAGLGLTTVVDQLCALGSLFVGVSEVGSTSRLVTATGAGGLTTWSKAAHQVDDSGGNHTLSQSPNQLALTGVGAVQFSLCVGELDATIT